MRPRSRLLALLGSVMAASLAIGEARRQQTGVHAFTPIPDPVSSAAFVRVSGSERLAWDQFVSSPDEWKALRLVIYVDGVPTLVRDFTCGSIGGPVLRCTTRLPAMSPGRHTIELSTYVERHGRRLDSGRSDSLFVERGSYSDVPRTAVGERHLVTTGDVELQPSVVLAGLEDPTALVALPDGRLLVAERQGRVRVVRDGALLPEPAVVLAGVVLGDGRGLLALALDREFARTGAVYAAYTSGAGLRLARLRMFGDALTSHATLLEDLPVASARPAVALTAAVDGTLHLALDDEGNPARAGDFGSYSGKVLRVNGDGTTPSDQPSRSPVFFAGVHRPTAIAADGDGHVWVAEANVQGVDRIQKLGMDPSTGRGVALARYSLPADTGAVGAALYQHDAIPAFRGSLLISASQAEAILRVWFREDGGIAGTEWLLEDEFGAIRAVAVDRDGAIWAATPTTLVKVEGRVIDPPSVAPLSQP
jgi:glucose/arabinose dehydrogenase